MLRRTSSAELTEWRAYEFFSGPLGVDYERAILRDIHLLLQHLIRKFVEVNTEKGKKVEWPEPKAFPAPNDLAPENDEEEKPEE